MTNRLMLAGGCAVVIVLAHCSTGCGRSSHLLAPDPGSTRTLGAIALEQDGATSPSTLDDKAEDSRGATPIDGPTTIDQSGKYRLTRDLEVRQGDAIVITASHVRLWLGDHRLRGPGNKVGRALVIESAQDVVVRGGRVESFGFGAVLTNASGCRLQNLRVFGGDETADPASGNPPQVGIMLVNSPMNDIVENQMRDVNLGIFVRGGGSYENSIEGNSVVGGAHGLLGVCYNPAPGTDLAGPMKDRVKSNVLARFGTGISASQLSSQNVFAMNTIHYFNAAYEDKNGTNLFIRNRTTRITP